MKANTIFTAIGLSLALGVPSVSGAQQIQPTQPTQQTQKAQQTNRRPTRSAATPTRKTVAQQSMAQQSTAQQSMAHNLGDENGYHRLPFLVPPLREEDDPGDNFTSSSLRSMTQAGNIGVNTGTSGSDFNGQIGTTNQGNLVHGAMGGGLFTFHFGSGGYRKPRPVEEHRSPRTKDQAGKDQSDSKDRNSKEAQDQAGKAP